jgi:phage-related tail protein
MKQAVLETPKQTLEISKALQDVEKRLADVNRKLNGDASVARREFETSPAINGRIGYVIGSLWNTTAAPTQTQLNNYQIAAKQFTPVYNELKAIAEEVKRLESILEKNGAPYTPGRLPEWKSN